MQKNRLNIFQKRILVAASKAFWFIKRKGLPMKTGRSFAVLCVVCLVTAVNLITVPNAVLCHAVEIGENEDTAERNIHIVLDPGHGGSQPGAERGSIMEKDVNLKIAHYLKVELEKYEGVTVTLTRDGDETVELEERTKIALNENADVLISLHNNSTGPCCPYDNGSTVLVAKGGYNAYDADREQLVKEEQKLGCNILNELESAGLANQGLLLRDSEADECYEDGTLADYYAIIRNGVLNNLPSILIEHAFLDDDSDYETYLSSDDGLHILARADAQGIARYYQLIRKKTGEILPELINYQAKLVHVRDGNAENNDITYQTYYEETDVGTSDSGTMSRNSGENDDVLVRENRDTRTEETSTEYNRDNGSMSEKKSLENSEISTPEQGQDVRENSFVFILAVIVVILLSVMGGALWRGFKKRK